MKFNYQDCGLSFKLLVTIFILFVSIGYIFGLINIHNNVGLSYTGIVTHYRGSEEEAVPPDFAFSKLIQEHHVHLFALSMLFFMVGGLFVITNLPEKLKVPIVLGPFIGMFFDFGGIWLVSFFSGVYGWISIVFGGFMAFSFFMILGRPLYEMWVLPVITKSFSGNIPWFLK